MPINHIIILGAGPSGLSAAIALAKLPPSTPPLRITLIELRPTLQTIGGTINVTPLAIRYLDSLGAGERIRSRAIDLNDGLDYISLRTGLRIGNIWGGIGGLRVARHVVVESLFETLTTNHADTVDIQWGKRTTAISETDDQVVLEFEDGTTLHGDVLLGCDGLHSAARKLYVEPERESFYTNRVIAMGWVEDNTSKKASPPLTLSTDEPALRDTNLIFSSNGMLLTSYYEPTRRSVYFANAMMMDEPKGGGDARGGWKLRGNDQDAVKRDVVQAYQTGRVKGLQDLLARCENWHLYPVYVLPGQGRWSCGRVIIIGDAAHAMPPQGESTGLAIEDAVLMSHVFSRHSSRSVTQLFSDYETLRRDVIEKYHRDAMWQMNSMFVKTSWAMGVALEWGIWVYSLHTRWGQKTHFGGDVRALSLPA